MTVVAKQVTYSSVILQTSGQDMITSGQLVMNSSGKTLVSTRLSIHEHRVVFLRGVKWPYREADHSPSSSTKAKCVGLSLHSPHTSSWRDA